MRRPVPPRMFFAALPGEAWIEALRQRLTGLGLDQALGDSMIDLRNLHQSLSERIFDPGDRERETMLRIGAGISAHACTLEFNRIEGPDLDTGRTHCTLRARGLPRPFSLLLQEVQAQLVQAGLSAIASGVTPHMTLSYDADKSFNGIPIEPSIPWTIEHLCLVIGSGRPYGYQVVECWPLLPEVDPPRAQLGLF